MKLIALLLGLMVFYPSVCIAEDEVILPLRPATLGTETFVPSIMIDMGSLGKITDISAKDFVFVETFLLLFIESIREMVIEECIKDLAIWEEDEADWDTYRRKAVNRLKKLKLKPLKIEEDIIRKQLEQLLRH